MKGQRFWELFLSEKIFGMFTLGTVAWGALLLIKDPETIVAGAIGAIAGFVTAEAASMLREQRRLAREDLEANVINLKRAREEKIYEEALNVANGTGVGPAPDPGTSGMRGEPDGQTGD